MTSWKRVWLVLLAVVVSLGAFPVFAAEEEETGSFENVRLWLYPEYDDPGLLVMLQGEIVGVDCPVTVRFLVPQSAVMYSAGTKDEAGEYSGGPPAREASGVPGWAEISYVMSTDTFRVEYYDDIVQGAPDRSIDYQFRTLYPIADLKVYAQEPVGSSSYSVTGFGESSPAVSGEFDGRLTTHSFSYQTLGIEDVFDFRITYERNTSELSLALLNPGSSTDRSSPSSGVAIAVTVAVLIVLGGGAFWVYRAKPSSRRVPVKRDGPVKHKSGSSRSVERKAPAGGFCTNCGEPLTLGDRFCGGCGAKIG